MNLQIVECLNKYLKQSIVNLIVQLMLKVCLTLILNLYMS